jgi:hypothetical protein
MNDEAIAHRPKNRLRPAAQDRAASRLSRAAASDHEVGQLLAARIIRDASETSLSSLQVVADAIHQAGGEIEFRETITIVEE